MPYFWQRLARDDRGSSNFQNTSTKLLYFCIFAKISAHDNKGSSNFQITSTKRFFLQKFQLVIIGAVQILKTLQQNVLFSRKFQLLIIEEVQIFKSHQQNCFIFVNIPARDNRGRSNFLSECIGIVSFSWTLYLVIIGTV